MDEPEIAPLPEGPFDVIEADPAWAFKTFKRNDAVPARRDPYRTMPLKDIIALPVKDVAAKNCHLFLWITGPLLVKAVHLEVMKAWGFKPSGMGFTWVKLKASHNANQLRVLPTAEGDLFTGMGYTTRKNAEFCLIGRRGSPKRHAKDIREIILSPVREHSRKPDETFDRIERYGGECRRLTMFSRQERPGWVSWGNQTNLFPEKTNG